MNASVRQEADVILRRRAIGRDERHEPIGIRVERRDAVGDARAEHGCVEQRDAAATRLDGFHELGPAFDHEQRMLVGGAANRRYEVGVGREHEERRAARREQLANRRGRQRRVERA